LGQEGEVIAILRPFVPCRELFLVKLSVNAVAVLGHASVYVLILGLATGGRGASGLSYLLLIVEGIVGVVVWIVLGTALGFLLPDFASGSRGLSGASPAARALFALIGGSGGVGYLSTKLAARSGALGTAELAGVGTGFALSILVVSALLGRWAIHRMEGGHA
jgi:hypothetical protein